MPITIACPKCGCKGIAETNVKYLQNMLKIKDKEIKKAKEEVIEQIYQKAKKLGRREIPDCGTDWTDLMRWLEKLRKNT